MPADFNVRRIERRDASRRPWRSRAARDTVQKNHGRGAAVSGDEVHAFTANGKLSTAPASTLEGRIFSMAGPLVSAIDAEADFVGSAWLVAINGDRVRRGSDVGAV